MAERVRRTSTAISGKKRREINRLGSIKKQQKRNRILSYIFLSVFTAVISIPIVWIIITAFYNPKRVKFFIEDNFTRKKKVEFVGGNQSLANFVQENLLSSVDYLLFAPDINRVVKKYAKIIRYKGSDNSNKYVDIKAIYSGIKMSFNKAFASIEFKVLFSMLELGHKKNDKLCSEIIKKIGQNDKKILVSILKSGFDYKLDRQGRPTDEVREYQIQRLKKMVDGGIIKEIVETGDSLLKDFSSFDNLGYQVFLFAKVYLDTKIRILSALDTFEQGKMVAINVKPLLRSYIDNTMKSLYTKLRKNPSLIKVIERDISKIKKNVNEILSLARLLNESLKRDNISSIKSEAISVNVLPDISPIGKEDIKAFIMDPFLRVFGNRIVHKKFERFTFDNFVTLFTKEKFLVWFQNSLVVSSLTSLFCGILGILAGYAFSRFSFPGRNFGLNTVLVTQLFPMALMLVPLYILASRIGLLNNLLGLIIAYSTTALPFSIWMLKGYFDTIPLELEEAAAIDGCSTTGRLWHVILPLARPAMATTILYSFITAWNEYFIASVFNTESEDLFTLPVGIVTAFSGGVKAQFTEPRYSLFSASAIIVSIPIVILFLYLQKHLISGLLAGSVKG